MRSLVVVCVLIPRFPLLGALGSRRELIAQPVALAPEAGREQRVGEASAAAEAFGVAAGMGLGEAVTRCPELRLVPPDPEGTRALWAGVLDRLEAIGAGVESDVAGTAFFSSDGLHGVHGGGLEGVLAAARRSLRRGAPLVVSGVRIGAAPSRFCAYVAATRARPGRRRREVVVPGRAARSFLAPMPVGMLRARPELDRLPDVLERLGLGTLGKLAELPPPTVAERFGHPGLLALDLAQGRDSPLQARRPPEPVREEIGLCEATSGPQLERALELLVERLLTRTERRGRTLRALAISARFVEGGTWRAGVTLRRASADRARLKIALAPRLGELPAPAESLALEVEAFGPPAHDQARLSEEVDPRETRRARLGEAVRQARQAAGEDAALRVLDVDPGSRVPERRSALAPYPVEEGDR
jgi:protein ImuB